MRGGLLRRLSLWMMLSIVWACSNPKNLRTANVNVEPPMPAGNTAGMVRMLDSITRHQPLEANYSRNKYIVQSLKAKVNTVSKEEYPFLLLRIGQELYRAGDPHSAVAVLQNVINQGGGWDVLNADNRPYFEALAMAYMRLGEVENCTQNHNAQSCLLPLQGGGIHVYRQGSENAVAAYTRLLAQAPNDLTSRWLLNIAHMTLGQYPDQVPTQYLIPGLDHQPRNPRLPHFEEGAMGLGLAVNDISGGCIVDDFNRDYLPDVLVSSYGVDHQLRYFINQGDGKFVEKTHSAGLSNLTGGLNMVQADFNNDGWMDALVLRGAWFGKGGLYPNSLLLNKGDGTFEDVTESAGMLAFHPTQVAAWADFNLDGHLDVFIGNESTRDSPNHPCELYLNQGDDTFRNVAKQLGLDVRGFVKGADWGDVNRDGLPDLYISFMGQPNQLWINRGGNSIADWKMEEQAAKAGVLQPIMSFPTWFWDYDNDGYEDLFVAGYDVRDFRDVASNVAREYLGMPSDRSTPRLYRNRGDGTFEEVSQAAGIRQSMYAMGSNYGDLNNDGWLDFYLGTGSPEFQSIVPNKMFLGGKNGQSIFEDVTHQGFGHLQKGHAISFTDIDNDGDQDVYSVMGGAFEGDNYPNVLFINHAQNTNWVSLKLEGSKANRAAIGTQLELEVTTASGQTRRLYRTVNSGGSFGASNLRQEIGLGDATQIDRLTIRWQGPDSPVQTFTNLPIKSHLLIKEGNAKFEILPLKPVSLSADHGHHHHHGS